MEIYNVDSLVAPISEDIGETDTQQVYNVDSLAQAQSEGVYTQEEPTILTVDSLAEPNYNLVVLIPEIFLTPPNQIVRGQENIFLLDKLRLSQELKILNDSYFSDMDNWKSVAVKYVSEDDNQNIVMVFDVSETIPQANFDATLKAKQTWKILSVTVFDFDGGYIKLQRSDLEVTAFILQLV
jgi:hypothetical protein